MGILYYKLVAFIPNTKDVWDFCLGGLNQTMAMQSEIIADMYQTDYGFGTNLKGTKSTQYQTREQILGKVKTNKNLVFQRLLLIEN